MLNKLSESESEYESKFLYLKHIGYFFKAILVSDKR